MSQENQVQSGTEVNEHIRLYVNKKLQQQATSKIKTWTTIGLVFLPILISFFVWVSHTNIEYNQKINKLDTKITILEAKDENYIEIKEDVKFIKKSLNDLNVKMARIEGIKDDSN